jgi:hypothetical protein
MLRLQYNPSLNVPNVDHHSPCTVALCKLPRAALHGKVPCKELSNSA